MSARHVRVYLHHNRPRALGSVVGHNRLLRHARPVAAHLPRLLPTQEFELAEMARQVRAACLTA